MFDFCSYYLGLRTATPQEVARDLATKVANHQQKPFDSTFVVAERPRWASVVRKHGVAEAYNAYQAAAGHVPETATRTHRNEMMAATGLVADSRYQDQVSPADEQSFAEYRAYCDAQAQTLFDTLPRDEPSISALTPVRRQLSTLTCVEDPRRRAVELKLVTANIRAGSWADAFGVLHDVLDQDPEALLVRPRDPLTREKHSIMGPRSGAGRKQPGTEFGVLPGPVAND